MMEDHNEDEHDLPPRLTIEGLPIEMLYEILKWIPDKGNNIDVLANVCNRWDVIVEQWIGRTIRVSGNDHDSTSSLRRISEVGISTFRALDFRELPTPLPSVKRPHMLKELCLFREIHPDLFSHLLRDASNLCKFKVSLCSVSHMRRQDLSLQSTPGLKSLSVYCLSFSGIVEPHAERLGLTNLRLILKESHFPQLSYLELDFPVESFQDFETLKVLVPYIQSHSGLKELHIRMLFPELFNPIRRVHFQDNLDDIIARIRGSPSHSLKVLRIHSSGLRRTYPHLEVWKEFIKKCSLQFADLWLGRIESDLLQTFCSRNGSTLEDLRISTSTQDDMELGQLVCNNLSSLQRLRRLYIHGTFETTQTRHLPPSLEFVTLSNVIMRPAEIEHILLHLPNLRAVNLMNLNHDNREGYGMTLEILQQVVQNREIPNFQLSSEGENFWEEYPEEGLPNGDPVNPMMLTLKYDLGLHWGLNAEGYYEDV